MTTNDYTTGPQRAATTLDFDYNIWYCSRCGHSFVGEPQDIRPPRRNSTDGRPTMLCND